MKKECPYCKEIIEGKHANYANHVRWCKQNPNYDEINKNKNISIGVQKNRDKKFGKYKIFSVLCNNCSKIVKVREREKQFPKKEKYFCNTSCANTRCHSEETKQKISKKVSISNRKLWKDPNHIQKMLSSQKSIFISKGEFAIRKYFQWNFPQHRWTFGGNLKHNGSRLIRDLYSNKLKICIEYDGIWHFKNICNQLDHKQKQDQALEDWCLKNNFRLIRIREEIFLKNEEFWINQLVKEVFSGVGKIVKFY